MLEPVWMASAPNSAEKAMAQAVIQLANAALKLDMGKPKAAVRLAGMVEALASDAARGGESVLGVEVAVLARLPIASKPDSLILAALEIIATGRSAHSRFSEPVASQLANDG